MYKSLYYANPDPSTGHRGRADCGRQAEMVLVVPQQELVHPDNKYMVAQRIRGMPSKWL
jgi:hypothetical protein